jgi:hypothetical protein
MNNEIDKLFDNKGEINAWDKSDAIKQIAKYANLLASGSGTAGTAPASQRYSEAQKEELLKMALTSERGKVALGQAMANPIRRNLDYQGIGRKALRVDPLPQGALPVYDVDIEVEAVVVSSHGAVPESRIQGDRVTVPEFEVVANPTVRIREVKQRRFNVIDRAQQLARQEIQAQEDANIFAALDFASTIENTAVAFAGATGVTRNTLNDLVVQVDRWDLVTSKIFMNIEQFADIRKFNNDVFDPVTQREVLQTGLFGHIWTADIIVSKVVPAGTIYCTADPEFVGVMPIRQDIEVIPADEPKELKLGWVVSEIIGIAIINPRGVAKAVAS